MTTSPASSRSPASSTSSDFFGNTAQLQLRPSPGIFRRSIGSESLRYTKYICAFQISARRKILCRMLLLNCALLPVWAAGFPELPQNLLTFSRCRAAPPSGSSPTAQRRFSHGLYHCCRRKGRRRKNDGLRHDDRRPHQGRQGSAARRRRARVRCSSSTRMPIPI